MENKFIEQEEKMLYSSPLVSVVDLSCTDIVRTSELEPDGFGDNDAEWW